MKTSLFSEKSFFIEEKRKNAVKARESGKAIKEISAWKEISVSENKAEKEPHKRASLESLFAFINSLYQIEKLLSLLSAILLFFALYKISAYNNIFNIKHLKKENIMKFTPPPYSIH